MKREGHEKVKFFVGPEVEHTPAFSKKTLFVVGKQTLDEIVRLAKEHKTPHIFMGANKSFSTASLDPYWDTVITALLDNGFWVSLDYPAQDHETVLKMLNPGIWQSRIFVPMLSVPVPQIENSSPNLTIKIDDVNFGKDGTNRGVWCLHFHEITDSNRFTDWVEYGNDVVLSTSEVHVGPANILPAKIKAEDVKNDASVGLDTTPTTALKPEETSVVSAQVDALEAYTAGTIADPLGKEATPKKPKVKKVAE